MSVRSQLCFLQLIDLESRADVLAFREELKLMQYLLQEHPNASKYLDHLHKNNCKNSSQDS